MKSKIKIVYSDYYSLVKETMVSEAIKQLKISNIEYDIANVPGSFEIPYEIARSIKEDTFNNENQIGSFKGKDKQKIRDNIVQMTKLSQLNINHQCIYHGYLALGCIIKGETINHQAISTSIFTNLQRVSIENLIPISNGIFNANNIEEAKKKSLKCTQHACNVLKNLIINDKKK